MSEAFHKYKEGLWTGTASTYRAVAEWIEEDLAMGRSLEGYPETLRKDAERLDAEKEAFLAQLEKENITAVLDAKTPGR